MVSRQIGRLQHRIQHSGSLRLKGELDYAALQRAVDAVVSRHEILRTRFMEEDGEPFQVIEANVQVPVISEDLSALSAGERGGR